MATSNIKEVSETAWDLLHQQMISLYFAPNAHPQPEKLVERLGFDVGTKLSERYVKDKARFSDDLDVITFVCKDFWTEVFKKQMDKLRTNHKGVYELQDHRFRALARISSDPGSADSVNQTAQRYLYFSCGIIRGVLSNLGITAIVTADVSTLPSCTFLVKIK